MPDREKVVKAIEICIGDGHCSRCGYHLSDYHATAHDCRDQMMEDAIALLKEQKPVEPKVDIDTWVCGKCGTRLERQSMVGDNVLVAERFDYCPRCGRAVKWE